MNALSIYIILRMGEGETDHNNFDTILLATMVVSPSPTTHVFRPSAHTSQVLFKQVTLSDQTYDPTPLDSDHALWIDWLYMESRRRLGIVYRAINLIVYFDLGALCSLKSSLLLAPLPEKRTLWEAQDAVAWKAERDKQPAPRTAFGLTTSGELVRIDERHLYGLCGPLGRAEGGNTSEQNWEEWCAGMDAFGGLIMLAASLVG